MARVIIIAEAGVNHNGNLDLAKELIDAAAEAGADYVKFQTFRAEKLVSRNARLAEYQRANLLTDYTSQLNMLRSLELTQEMHHELIDYCHIKNINFLSTAFDLESIDFLDSLNFNLYKIPSGEITNKPYLEKIGALGKQVILSTGMSTINEIDQALHVIVKSGTPRENVTILHCNTEYPTPYEDVNLLAMREIGSTCRVKYGYSDHTQGIDVPIAAVALGATIVEKHFTVNRNLEGPDHKASLEPKELQAMVQGIRNVEIALGSSIKEPTQSELKNIIVARKSIHLAHSIKSGSILQSRDLEMKRPGDGISPMEYEIIIGRRVKRDLEADYKLSWEDLQ